MTLAQEVLDGVMLGDGGIFFGKRSVNAHFHMSLSEGDKHIDWLKAVKENLVSLSIPVNPMYPKLGIGCSKGRVYTYAVLDSQVSELLTRQRLIWYPRGTKVVPLGLHLTPVVVANWFMGDGSSREISPGYIEVRFATQSFNEGEVERLERLLSELGVHGSYHYMDPSGPVIVISTIENVSALLDLIGPLILPSYEYKLKRPRRAAFRVIKDKLGRVRVNGGRNR